MTEQEKNVTSYIFRLNNFKITNIRAHHEDTAYVSFTLKVGDHQFQTLTKNMGGVNNGIHNIGLEFGPIDISIPDTSVLFNYQIVNAGHSGESSIVKGLESGATGMLSAGGTVLAASLGGGIWGIVIGGALGITTLGIGELFKLLTANCDGLVAVDQVAVKEATLENWVSNSGSHSETRFYPGYDSPHGCGSNSRYYVTWSVKKV